jgi:Spy/CpxP family protein refolding chaperone
MKRSVVALFAIACATIGAASANAQSAAKPDGGMLEHFCSGDSAKAPEGHLAETLASRLVLNDAQKAAFKDWQDTRRSARDNMKATVCADKSDAGTLAGRLALHQKFLQARLAAMEVENPKLLAFYDTLDAKQKAIVDGVHMRWRH